jgi:DNA-directed RNA polymerase specialized sigma24 family protein
MQIFWSPGEFLMAGRYDSTSFGGSNSQFQSTEWTKIMNSSVSESILGELYMKYWRPVYSYLRRKGFNNDQAKDLIQGFFSEKILGQQLVQKADRTKGKFRTFLLTAIKNYAIDLYRINKPLYEPHEEIEISSNINDPETEFDIVWAKELLHSVLGELEVECRNRNKMIHWNIFRSWFLEPNISTEEANMSVICEKYGVDDVDKAYNMISNLKGRFRKILRHRFSFYLVSETEIDDEINHFIQIFSRTTTR